MNDNIDAKLFPPPYHREGSQRNPLFPRTWPGVTPKSTTALQAVLSDNHQWHLFWNSGNTFHNHSAHAVLSLWGLGADENVIRASYEVNRKLQRLAPAPPNPITKDNWKDHLGKGNEAYYHAYLEFFKGELEQKSFADILEEYIFSANANFVEDAEKQPEMLNRFLDGLLHPMIHTGLGVEFSLPGTFAEGLAQTAVHPSESSKLLPPSVFTGSDGHGEKGDTADVHAFTVLARVLADPTFIATKTPDPFIFYGDTVLTHGEAVKKYVDQWTLDRDLQKKVEELLWINTLIYGVAGHEETGPFNADFYHMHLVTSSIFLPTIFSLLKQSSQALLLRGYFSVSLAQYIGRGRPPLDIARFFTDPKTLVPVAPGPHPIPHPAVHPSPNSPYAITPDPWLPIIQSTLTHPDDHVIKIQRAMSEFASHFGGTPPGTFASSELKDAELIDGTLFIRTAGLTTTRLGWVREGDAPLEGVWERRPFLNVANL